MTEAPDRAVATFPTVDLAGLDARAALQTRHDRKHVVPVDVLARLLGELRSTHAVLEIDGRRRFTYDTVYFDTPELAAYRAHVQQRRRRTKVRSRLYVNSGVCMLEIKAKGGRGETVKHRIAHDAAGHGALPPAARDHVEATLGVPAHRLRPVLRTVFDRITVVDLEGEARLTADLGLRVDDVAARAELAIVEIKSATGVPTAERVLRRLGSRATSISKFQLGVGLLHRGGHANDSRRVARTLFA